MRFEPINVSRRAFAATLSAVTSGFSNASEALSASAHPLINVGPQRAVKTLAEAARLVVDGSRVAVDAGTYVGDVAVWTRNDLSLIASGGRVRLIADGAHAEGKGIWVVRARGMTVEGFDFEGAAVPSGNGAAIRLESGSLTVRDCSFTHNENGILTSNDPQVELSIENSEFARNTRPDGQTHLLYAGRIKRLSVTGSYFHHATAGHLLKSRAALNHIFYNRLTDEAEGRASYELEFASGGVAYVVGNIIQQSPSTENPHFISYGVEGYRWPVNELHLVHNTLVDDRANAGVFLRVKPGDATVHVVNNLLVGSASWNGGSSAKMHNNVSIKRSQLGTTGDEAFRMKANVAAGMIPLPVALAKGEKLAPDRQYLHPRQTIALRAPPTLPGALQPDRPPHNERF